jgi:hypothetical protein
LHSGKTTLIIIIIILKIILTIIKTIISFLIAVLDLLLFNFSRFIFEKKREKLGLIKKSSAAKQI